MRVATRKTTDRELNNGAIPITLILVLEIVEDNRINIITLTPLAVISTTVAGIITIIMEWVRVVATISNNKIIQLMELLLQGI